MERFSLRTMASGRVAIRVAVVSAAVWLLFAVGLSPVLDTPFADVVHRLLATGNPSDNAVLMVAFPVDLGTPELEARRVADAALELGAAGIVFLGGSFDSCEAFAGGTAAEPYLWEIMEAEHLGCGVVQHRDGAPQLASTVPPRDRGVVHRLGTPPPQHPVPTVEESVASLEHLPPLPRAAAPRFVGGSGSLPIISAEHMLGRGAAEGGIVAGMTRGRWVVIGQGSIPGGHGVHTPTTAPAEGMSELELRAQILNAVLEGDLIIHLPIWLHLPLCLVAGLAGTMIGRRGNLNTVALRLLGLGAVTAAAAVAGLFALSIWLPAIELIACSVVAAGDATRRRVIASDHALDALVGESKELLRGVAAGEAAQTTFDPQRVLVAFDQILSVDRILLLEAQPGQWHVRELAAERCSFSDLAERRRDIRRAPYSLALDAAAPIRIAIESRPFFKADHEDEHQYLVPLTFGSELFGFAGVATRSMSSDQQLSFAVSLQALAREVGELLYLRRAASGEINDSRAGSSSIARVLELLKLRLERHRQLLEDLSNGVVLYDLFGTVLEINDNMAEILGGQGIAPFRSSPFELLSSMTALDEERIRELIRQVVLEGGRATLPAVLKSDPERSMTLSLRPLSRKDSDTASYGLVCEIFDTAATARQDALRSEFAEHVDSGIRSDLGGIDLAAELLAADEIDGAARLQVVGTLRERVSNAVRLLDTGRRYLRGGISPDALEGFPVDVSRVLEDAIDELRPSLNRDTINVELLQPEEAKFVLASPEKLDRLIRAAVGLLHADAAFGSTLHLEVRAEEGGVKISLQSQGYGLPDQAVKASMESGATMGSLRELQRGRQWLDDWGGELELRSIPGEGTELDIQLRSVQ